MTFIDLEASEKLLLCHLYPRKRIAGFSVHSGSVYKVTTDYRVTNVTQSTGTLTKVASVAAIDAAGKWFWDSSTHILYIRSLDSTDPGTRTTVATVKVPFSNGYVDLADEDSKIIPYHALVKTLRGFDQTLDEENMGVIVESSGSISFVNGTEWKTLFDLYVWDNAVCDIWVTSRTDPEDDKKLLVSGLVYDKRYSSTEISLSIKDQFVKLRDKIATDLYSTADGNLPDYAFLRRKRRIYGRVDGVSCQNLDYIQGSGKILEYSPSDANLRWNVDSTKFYVEALTESLGRGYSPADIRPGDVLVTPAGQRLTVKTTCNLDLKHVATLNIASTPPSGTGVTVDISRRATDDIDLDVMKDKNVCIALVIPEQEGSNQFYTGMGRVTTWDTNSITVEMLGTIWHGIVYGTDELILSPGMLYAFYPESPAETAGDLAPYFTRLYIEELPAFDEDEVELRWFPSGPRHGINTQWQIAGHALHKVIVQITTAAPEGPRASQQTWEIDDADGIFPGDVIYLYGGTYYYKWTVSSVDYSTATIVANYTDTRWATIPADMTVGYYVVRYPMQQLYMGGKTRDIQNRGGSIITRDVDDKILTLTEAFITDSFSTRVVLGEVNQSGTVIVGARDLAGFSPRYPTKYPCLLALDDSTFANVSEGDYVYAVGMGVVIEKPNSRVIIVAWREWPTSTSSASSFYGARPFYYQKTPYIEELIVDTYGKEDADGALIATVSGVVKDLLEEAQVSPLDETSFAYASEMEPWLVSVAWPNTVDGDVPSRRDAISSINASVFGRVILNDDGDVAFSMADPTRTVASLRVVPDYDVVNYAIDSTSANVATSAEVRYGQKDVDVDVSSGNVNTFSTAETTETETLLLGVTPKRVTLWSPFRTEEDSLRFANRWLLTNGGTKLLIRLSAPLAFSDASLGDVWAFSIDTMFSRNGMLGTSVLGFVNRINKKEDSVDVTLDDGTGLFSRCGVISPGYFLGSTYFPEMSEELEPLLNCYITDDSGLLDGVESTHRANLIW